MSEVAVHVIKTRFIQDARPQYFALFCVSPLRCNSAQNIDCIAGMEQDGLPRLDPMGHWYRRV